MLGRIVHRGPDGGGTWSDGLCTLGHARLAIIDLTETGRQPIANEDGSIQAVVNGEIYNYRELRAELAARGHRLSGTSDSEVVPHLYEEFGPDFVNRLRGMFAIALWDAPRRRLVLARDRAGKKPLYYAAFAGGIAFASEMKALFAVDGVDLGIRPQAIHDYLSLGSVPGPQTVYRGIERVPPAHVATLGADGALSARRYWSLAFLPKHRIGRTEALAEIERLLREAVRLRLRSDVPVGCFLSGGIDSGLITALAAQESTASLSTFSIGFTDDAFDERPMARTVARRFGTDHHEFELSSPLAEDLARVVGHYDEPYSGSSALASFAVARLAAGSVKVVLNGDGGDEVFAGYRHVLAARLVSGASHWGGERLAGASRFLSAMLPAPRRGRTPYQFLHRLLRVVGTADDGSRILVLTGDRLDEAEKAALYNWPGARGIESVLRHFTARADRFAGLGPVDAMLLWDFEHLLADDHLVKMDMATMAHGLEARSPLLDHELISFVARLPENLKLPGRQTKPLLRALAARFLPPGIAHAPKRGFEIPLLRWMRSDLNGQLWQRMTDPASFCSGHFDRAQIESLLRGDGWDAKRWANVVWMLLCLEIWWDGYRTAATSHRPTLQAAE